MFFIPAVLLQRWCARESLPRDGLTAGNEPGQQGWQGTVHGRKRQSYGCTRCFGYCQGQGLDSVVHPICAARPEARVPGCWCAEPRATTVCLPRLFCMLCESYLCATNILPVYTALLRASLAIIEIHWGHARHLAYRLAQCLPARFNSDSFSRRVRFYDAARQCTAANCDLKGALHLHRQRGVSTAFNRESCVMSNAAILCNFGHTRLYSPHHTPCIPRVMAEQHWPKLVRVGHTFFFFFVCTMPLFSIFSSNGNNAHKC